MVGGGFAGLAVTARLARSRHQVTLVERAGELGGSLRGVNLDGGVRLPTAPTTFTMPAVLRDLFRTTGKPIEDVLELEPVGPARRYVFADGASLDLPSGGRVATMRAFDEALGPGAGAEWEALLVHGREIWDALRRNVVEAPLTGRRELARALASRRSLAALRPWRSWDSLARAALSDPRSRQLLDSYAVGLGAHPRHAPAALAVLPYLEHAFGVWRVRGGPVALVTALADRAVLRGAELRTGAEVAEIMVTGGAATGVRLRSGEQLPAEVVVAAIDILAAARLVVGARPWARGRPRAAGTARFTVVLGADERSSAPHPHHSLVETVYLSASTNPGTADAAIAATNPITVTYHGIGARELWTVSAPALAHDPIQMDWRAAGAATAYARTLLDLLAQRGTDLRGAPIRATQTPADLEDQTGAPGGTVLGPPLHGFSATFGRAANQSRTAGLYAVGASAHPGPGLPFVALSAVLVSDLVGAAPRRSRPAPTRPRAAGG